MADRYGDPQVIWQTDDHKCVWLGAGDPADEDGIPSNQYMIIDGDDAYVIDPGGHHIFERVFNNVTAFVDPRMIKGLFLSHQDPDIAAGIDLWLKRAPQAMVIISGLWIRFLMHLPLKRIPDLLPLRDDGDQLELASGASLRFIPAHFLHSPGNFSLYDERSRMLFSGDIGAATMVVEKQTPTVERFDEHIPLMEGFHRRYMACNAAVARYLRQLDGLKIDAICPQHGALIKGDDVARFVDWLAKLDVGVDYLDKP